MADSQTPTPTKSSGRWWQPVLGLARALAAVVCVIAFFSIADVLTNGHDAKFWTTRNLQTITVQNAYVAIAAIGMLLIIIAGGIDLSAGVAMSLCACVLAWGLREDVGFMIGHGENVAGAARRLKTADDDLNSARRDKEPAKTERFQKELDARRARLGDLLEIKLSQLKSQRTTADEELQSDLDSNIEEVQKALTDTRDPAASIEADPTWLRLIPNAPASTWLALLMGIGTGMLCGLLNGVLVVFLRVVPFIATLGTMTIYQGLAKIVADETSVRPSTIQVPDWLGELSAVQPEPAWMLVSKGVWLALILAVIIACILRYTVFGRYVFALGSNESTARLCGINVPLVKISIYALAGLLVGIAGICFFTKLNSGDPTSGMGLELKFIAAVVIGGGSLSGGRGTVLGTLAGTIIIGVIYSGCTLLGIRNPAQDIILGTIIIAAVTVDQFRQRRE